MDPGRGCKQLEHRNSIRTSQALRILSTTPDTKLGTRHALMGGTRTPGFASPGTFPSRCFSQPQGFTPSSPPHPCFMMRPLIGFPSLVWTATPSPAHKERRNVRHTAGVPSSGMTTTRTRQPELRLQGDGASKGPQLPTLHRSTA